MAPAADAALARAAACGDQSAFAAIYDRYADRLCDFCVGMLHDRDAAADCVQDVFVTAATRLAQLREPDRLRSWLYAIARNAALTRIRERRREQPTEQVPEIPSGEPDLATLAARSELAELIGEASGGLSDRDRVVLELAYWQGLDGYELAEALGVSHTNANTLVGRLRANIERSLGALLVSRYVKANPDRCPELAALLDSWDGQFTVLVRKRVARHIEACAVCDDNRRRMVSPVALLGGIPMFVPAPLWLRERTLTHASAVLAHLTAPPAPAAAQMGSGNGNPAAGPPHSASAGPSWWPPHDIDTADLGDSGPPPAPHPGTAVTPHTPHEPAGPTPSPSHPHDPSASHRGPLIPNQVLYQAPHIGSGPLTPVRPPTAGDETRHRPSHLSMTLLVALLLLVLVSGFLLGPQLVYRVWPTMAPGGPITPAPTPTTIPAGSSPTKAAATHGPAPTTIPSGSIPTGQTAPSGLQAQPPPTTVPAGRAPTDQSVPATPPARPPPTVAPAPQIPRPVALPTATQPTALTVPPPNTTVPATPVTPIPRRSAIGGSNGTCPPICSPNNGIK
jgi:RNA polymerase sigma factor (sigma-70 family)